MKQDDKTPDNKLRIGIDLDDCITCSPEFFRLLTVALSPLAEIHIITNREQTAASAANTRQELESLGIAYHHLQITAEKGRYIRDHNITVYFDDTDDHLLDLPETVTVFKIREPWNFDFAARKWRLYTPKSGLIRNDSAGLDFQ